MKKIIILSKWFYKESKSYVGYHKNGKLRYHFKDILYYPVALFKFIKFSWNINDASITKL